MSEHIRYDLCVIGGGSGGYAAASTARSLKRSVSIVDGAAELGGLCILRGCMPSKTLLRSAEVAHLVRRAPEFGVQTGPVRIAFDDVMARKRRIIKEFADHRVGQIEAFPLYRGTAAFVDGETIRCGDTIVHASKFIVATGSVVSVPAIPGLDETGYVTSDDVLEFDALPKSVVILGGGTNACELGQYLVRLGVRTTMVQRSKAILSSEDEDVSAAARRFLEEDGITVITGATVRSVSKAASGKRVQIESDGRQQILEADEIFAALGRRADVAGLELERAGVRHDQGGIEIDAYLRTSNPNIFAVGDVVRHSAQLVHVAVHEGELAARNALCAEPKPIDTRLAQSRAIFTDPQVAVTGLTERECKQRNVAYTAARFPFDDLGKAISIGETKGFVKMLAAPDGTILGVAVVGPEASDLIHEAIALVYFRANVRDVMAMAHLHPTLSEIFTYPAEELCECLEHETRALVTP
jgi:pyruvate/2-oxoglutarate dehydrogenase complex dihydrolipoamide dehydrogenase (E3) component